MPMHHYFNTDQKALINYSSLHYAFKIKYANIDAKHSDGIKEN